MSSMGSLQDNSLVSLTIDIWQDKVFFQEQEFPAGYFATEILNRSRDDNDRLLVQAGKLYQSLQPLYYENIWQPQIREQASALLPEIWTIAPFSLLPQEQERELIGRMFTEETQKRVLDRGAEPECFEAFMRYFFSYVRVAQAVVNYSTVGLTFEYMYLHRLKKRNETFFAYALHDCFYDQKLLSAIHEIELLPVENFSLEPEMDSTFVFARHPSHEKEMVFVSRLIFEKYVDFYTYDLMNGLHHGHAPHCCENCGHFFLTTNGHMPKYCDNISPQDSRFTCRQMGARMHEKEKNDQHPVYRLFRTKTNTIRKHHERGKISDELRRAALQEAERLRERALMDRGYAQEGYAQDMELERLYEAAKKRLSGRGQNR